MKKFVGRLKDGNSVLIFSESNKNLMLIENGFDFPVINTNVEKKFQPDYKLADDEWFYVVLNADDKALMAYIPTVESTADINNIIRNQYKDLAVLYLANKDSDGKIKIIFNRIFNKFYITSKIFLKFIDSGEAIVTTEENVVEFNSNVDAYWDGNSSKLYFKNYLTIKPLFKGIDKFYRSATSEEVDSFVKSDFFKVEDTFKSEDLGERALRHIAGFIDDKSINFNDLAVRKNYNEYAKIFSESGFSIAEDGKFILAKASDLTHVINLLQERYYTTQITNEKRVAHSTSIYNKTGLQRSQGNTVTQSLMIEEDLQASSQKVHLSQKPYEALL